MGTFSRLVLVLLALLSFSLTPPPAPAAEWRDVTDDRLANAGSDPANWLMYSRTYNGWRYSPLDQINTGNIKKLVPKWIFAGGVLGEQQMTPVVNSGENGRGHVWAPVTATSPMHSSACKKK